MRVAIRKAGVACGALATSAVLAFSGAAPSWASSSTLVVGGLGTPHLADIVMAQLLGGIAQGQTRVSVEWPAEAAPYTGKNDMSLGDSIAVGIDNLSAELDAALDRLSRDGNGNVINGEKVYVMGLSAGSLVVTEKLRLLVDDLDAPGADELSVYVVADSSRQALIKEARYNPQLEYTYQKPPETVYNTVVVSAEFDLLNETPDRWWNVLAWVNAAAGSIVGHIPVMFADLDDVPADYISQTVNSQGGVTTHYLVPVKELPLVTLLPFLKPFEASLRAAVERGYSRYDKPPYATSDPLATAPAQAAVMAEPAEDLAATEPEDEGSAAAEADVDLAAAESEDSTEAEAAEVAEAVATDDAADELESVSDAADDLDAVTDDEASDDETTGDEVDLLSAVDDEVEAELADTEAEADTAKSDDEESDSADDSDAAADSGDADDSDTASDDSGSEDSGSDE